MAIVQPLTWNGVAFQWTEESQAVLDRLKQSLTIAPFVCYPSFDSPFIIEADANIKGIGAILSQSNQMVITTQWLMLKTFNACALKIR